MRAVTRRSNAGECSQAAKVLENQRQILELRCEHPPRPAPCASAACGALEKGFACTEEERRFRPATLHGIRAVAPLKPAPPAIRIDFLRPLSTAFVPWPH
jgi:hypothetical protein